MKSGPKPIHIPQGSKYGNLEVLSEASSIPWKTWKLRVFTVKCVCGNVKDVRMSDLRSGRIVSCGCIAKGKIMHGLSTDPLYNIWLLMISRCFDKANRYYHRYGGRGISVDPIWIGNPVGLANFIDWSRKNGYRSGLQIDRQDNNLNYSPTNCRFVTQKTNGRNKQNTLFAMVNGSKIRFIDLWESSTKCVTYSCAKRRYVNLGWSAQDAVHTSKGQKP